MRAAPLLVASWISAQGEGPRRAAAYLLAAIVVTVVAIVSPPARRMLDRSVWRLGQVLGTGVGFIALVITEAIALIARATARFLGREALGWTRVDASSTWAQPRVHTGVTRRRAKGVPTRRRTRRVAPAFALIVVLVAVDVAAGSFWNRASEPDTAGETFPFAGARPPLPAATFPGHDDGRADARAFAESPWADDFFRELQEQGYETQPYRYTTYRDRSGRYLNISDNVRASYPTNEGPVVWFFGGSAVFGEGQRDDHTIPSEFARLAQADGQAVQVVNFGVQADSDYQSMLRLEHALATRRPLPDLVIFYDGANEISQHLSQPATNQPQLFEGTYAGGPSSPEADDDVWSAWRRASLMARLFSLGAGSGVNDPPAPEDQLVEQILGVYGRGQRLARSMATDAGAEFVSFFQPARFYEETTVDDAVRAQLPAETVDLSAVLARAGDEIYFDSVHTNEEGARRVAETMYDDLRDEVRQLRS